MNLPLGLDQALQPLLPHLWPVALCATRLLPICLMCPLFGGAQAPVQVRLSMALLLALFVHLGCGVELPTGAREAGLLVPAFATQLLAGVATGYVASLPFHAARIGGRLLDTFRGATSESRLPEDVDKDAATAGLLHPLLVALLCAGPGHRLFIAAVVKGFATLPLAASGPSLESIVERCAAGALAVMATGLAIGAESVQSLQLLQRPAE
jgi:type III secretion protein T